MAKPAPQPGAQLLYNNQLAQEAGIPYVNWVFCVGIQGGKVHVSI